MRTLNKHARFLGKQFDKKTFWKQAVTTLSGKKFLKVKFSLDKVVQARCKRYSSFLPDHVGKHICGFYVSLHCVAVYRGKKIYIFP